MKKNIQKTFLLKAPAMVGFWLLLNLIPFKIAAQNDSIPYEDYDNNLVLYTDYGYTSGPFSIKYAFPGGVSKLKYRNNYKDVLGVGMSYKWLSLRLSFSAKGNARSVQNYGKTNFYSLGTSFTVKKFYWEIDLRTFTGYAIKNAYKWNDTLSPQEPNDIRSNTKSFGFSINTWYFHNKGLKMNAIQGKTGHYTKEVQSFYVKSTFNIYGISNNNQSMIPSELIDQKNSKTSSPFYTAVDLGLIPGYAYVNRKNNWQYSGFLGLGAVLQSKYYSANNVVRGFVGLAPRYDFRIVGGYSVPKYFVFLLTSFDNKSIRFQDFVYRQSFYSIQLVAGYRFPKKEKHKKDDPKKDRHSKS